LASNADQITAQITAVDVATKASTDVSINNTPAVKNAVALVDQRTKELAAAPTAAAVAQAQLDAANISLTNAINIATSNAATNVTNASNSVAILQSVYDQTLVSETADAAAEVMIVNNTLTNANVNLKAFTDQLAADNVLLGNNKSVLAAAKAALVTPKLNLDNAVADVVTKTTDRDNKAATLTIKQNALDVAVAADNANSTPSTQAAVTAATTERNNANTALNTAQTALNTSITARNQVQQVVNSADQDVINAQAQVDIAQTNVAGDQQAVASLTAQVTITTTALAEATANNTAAAILLRPVVVTTKTNLTNAQNNLATAQTNTSSAAINATAGVVNAKNAVIAAQAALVAAPNAVINAQAALTTAQNALATAITTAKTNSAATLSSAQTSLQDLNVTKAEKTAEKTAAQGGYDAAIAALPQVKQEAQAAAFAVSVNGTTPLAIVANTASQGAINGVIGALNSFLNTGTGINLSIETRKTTIEADQRTVITLQKSIDDTTNSKTKAQAVIAQMQSDSTKWGVAIAENLALAAKWKALLDAALG
jgi:hypothetical protein